MLKGQGGLQWVFITLALTLIIVTVTVMLLHGAIDRRIKMDAMYNSLEVSGIINLLQAAPIETSMRYSLHSSIEVLEDRIVVEGYTTYLVTTPVEIEPGDIQKGEKSIMRQDKIRIEDWVE